MVASVTTHPRRWLSTAFIFFTITSLAVAVLQSIILHFIHRNNWTAYEVEFRQKTGSVNDTSVLISHVPDPDDSSQGRLVQLAIASGVTSVILGIIVIAILVYGVCATKFSKVPNVGPHVGYRRWLYSIYLILLFGDAILALVALIKVFKNHYLYSNFDLYALIWPPADWGHPAFEWNDPTFTPCDLETWVCSWVNFNGTDSQHSTWVEYCPIIEAGRYVLIPHFIASLLAFPVAYFGLRSHFCLTQHFDKRRSLALARQVDARNKIDSHDWEASEFDMELIQDPRYSLRDAPSHLVPGGELPTVRLMPSEDLDRLSEGSRVYMPYQDARKSAEESSSRDRLSYPAHDSVGEHFEIPTPSTYQRPSRDTLSYPAHDSPKEHDQIPTPSTYKPPYMDRAPGESQTEAYNNLIGQKMEPHNHF